MYATLLRTLPRRFSCVAGSDYSVTPLYPPILDMSPEAVERRKQEEKYHKLNCLHTVEEKLFGMNLDKYYGWNSIILREYSYPFHFLPFVRFITRTYLVEESKELFDKVQNVDAEECKVLSQTIRSPLQEAILFELKGKKRSEVEGISNQEQQDNITKDVIESLNNVVLSVLSIKHPHLLQSVVDYKPRLEAFWKVGSFHPSDELYKERQEKKLDESEQSALVEHWIQYFGKPIIQLRNTLPLPVLETQHLKEYNEPGILPNVPLENHDPSLSFGVEFERRHGTNIPGFWPGDENEFGILSYHLQGYLIDRPPDFGVDEHGSTVVAQAILSSYAWLHGQACYQGFSTFSDVTYPLVTQNIITDGQHFTFSLYQLNTMLLHSEYSMNNERVNLCINLPTSALYQEISGNEFIGWNDDVVATLLSFYLKKPTEREGVELKPYLHATERYVADIEENERRVWLHQQFRHMYTNRPRSRLPYEIYDWERIFKIKFQTRPMDARARPFELDANPMEDRKYSDHVRPYIPKKFRPRVKHHWNGWRAKFAKTYYPDV